MSKPVEAVRAALEEDVMQLRLHVGGSFAGELPHVYVSFAFGSTKDCSMEPVRDDGVCNPAHVQALRVRIADPSRMWAAGPSIGTAEEVVPVPWPGQQDIYLAVANSIHRRRSTRDGVPCIFRNHVATMARSMVWSCAWCAAWLFVHRVRVTVKY